VLNHKLRTGQELRLAPIHAISARGVDQLYDALQKGKRVARRLRTATLCMMRWLLGSCVLGLGMCFFAGPAADPVREAAAGGGGGKDTLSPPPSLARVDGIASSFNFSGPKSRVNFAPRAPEATAGA
jgi:hypothetical protein